jgi:hypothetical protein
VTGWRRQDGTLETYLFYQGEDDGLRYSRCDTALIQPDSNSTSCWTPPVAFESSTNPDTQLGATTIVWGDEYQPQIELFYSGLKTRLLGVNFNENLRPVLSQGAITHLHIHTTPNTGVTSYWPWTLFQLADGSVRHLRNLLVGDKREPNKVDWDINPINVTALTGSRLAVVPMSSNSTYITSKAGYAVFYQDPTTKQLAVAVPDLHNPEVKPVYRLPWPIDSTTSPSFPAVTLPDRSPIAALSVARPRADPAHGQVDTYLLHMDEKGEDIHMLYTAPTLSSLDDIGESGTSTESAGVEWRRAQPAVLKGVDKDTDIACLNLATTLSIMLLG